MLVFVFKSFLNLFANIMLAEKIKKKSFTVLGGLKCEKLANNVMELLL